ncbi:IS66 family insertion sequence element accessory protein TnpA [Novipirellula artificiosorum]|uniref:Transposase n=1 Tax=Novipirellula artificiosorum TaxID=2528016 RepID=A0A5C6DUY0_9BACT|nr:hypothetical protein [Novipirellula artificiosorum]TWU39747.1 hypothetical protein Poly41_26030 [Novipirellula artificiosorum]
MARLPNPQLAQQWRERLERFAHSELTIAEFCELEGYLSASFYQWRRKLRSGELRKAPAFVPVDFNPSDLEGGAQRGVEIDLPGGAIVKVPVGATMAEQRQLIEAVVQATSAEVGS